MAGPIGGGVRGDVQLGEGRGAEGHRAGEEVQQLRMADRRVHGAGHPRAQGDLHIPTPQKTSPAAC